MKTNLYFLVDTHKKLKKAAKHLLIKYADQAPKQWYDFLDEVYDGGKRKVKNTNPDGKDYVSASYLLQMDGNYLAKLQNEYKSWLKNKSQGELFTDDLEQGEDIKKYKPKSVHFLNLDLEEYGGLLTDVFGKKLIETPDPDSVDFDLEGGVSEEDVEEMFSREIDSLYRDAYDEEYDSYMDRNSISQDDERFYSEDEDGEQLFDEDAWDDANRDVREDAERSAEDAGEDAKREAFRGFKEKYLIRKSGEILRKHGLTKSKALALMGLSALSQTLDVTIGEEGDGNGITLDFGSTDEVRSLQRTIKEDEDGERYLYQEVLYLKDNAPKGLGTKIFASQVYHAKKAGLKYIKCDAHRGYPNWIGYKIWPKMGYDGEIPEDVVKKLPKDILDKFEKLEIKEPYKISHLYSLPDDEGIKWWEEHGTSFDAYFDLSDDSESMKTLASYLFKKKGEFKKKASLLKKDPLLKGLISRLAFVSINLIKDKNKEESKGKKKKGPSPRWIQFLKEEYDSGKKKVPNTNPKTKNNPLFREVAMSTLLKNDSVYREKINKEYKEWLKKEDKEEKNKRKPSNKKSDKYDLSSLDSILKKAFGEDFTKEKDFEDYEFSGSTESSMKFFSEVKSQYGLSGAQFLSVVGLSPIELSPSQRVGFSLNTYPTSIYKSVYPTGPFKVLHRALKKDLKGDNYLYNDTLLLYEDAPKGLGTKIFSSQVYHAKKAGLKYIKCSAHRDEPKWVGFKVWPKMGYDGEIPDHVVARFSNDIREKLENLKIKEPYKVSHLYSLPDDEGIKWWEKNGDTFDAYFDLSDDSESMKTLHKYLEKKASENN